MAWLSWHIQPLEVQDVFLVRAVRPFLMRHVWADTTKRAFFIRFADDSGPHIRLRIGGDEDWLSSVLQPAFEEHFAGRGAWTVQPYIGEADRFGGAEPLAWAEEHFHVSTRVVLDRLSRDMRTYGDLMYDALQMHTTLFFTAWMDQKEAASYCSRLCDAWINNFFVPAPDADPAGLVPGVRADFEATLAPQKARIRAALAETWHSLRQQQHDPKQPEWLRWVRGNQLILSELQPVLERAMPNLIHLTNNRLGVNNQDETYLLYILSEGLAG
jgi:thiopeptide-type bacteriocin biosynthesis protein